MEFKDFAAKQQLVEAALGEYFPAAPQFGQVLNEAMRYSLFAGGKRFRAVLLLMAYEAIRNDFEIALPSACAVEYIHSYSLIHDDLPAIDNDDLRRGKPTCHKKYGEAIALLAGDALFAEAFNVITKYQKSEPKVLVDVLADLSEAAGSWGMVGGQVVDVILSGSKQVSGDELDFIHNNKTGKLILAAATIGARLAGASIRQLRSIEQYAINLGMAFQIYDDILDEIGETEVMGKSKGSDQKQSKVTYPAMYGLDEASHKALEASKQAIIAINGINSSNLVQLAKFVVKRDN